MFCCGAGDGGAAGGSGDQVKFARIEAKGWKVDPEAIGEGGFGAVHLCTHLSTGKRRACKAMRLPEPQDREDFRHEVAVLRKCGRHKNICHVIDVAEDHKYGYLVMQSCTGGELFDRIAERKCTERDSAMAVVDVLSALNFLHSKRILHRDLKPENLLYKDKAPGSPLKLIDFGLAIQLQQGQRESEVCGTTSYMAPEVLRGSYSVECDIWSLGVICYFMLSGKLPFPGRNDDEKEARILRGTIQFKEGAWQHASNDAKDFIRKLLVPDERKRMSGRKALQHPWIQQRSKLSETPCPKEVAESVKRYAEAHRFQKMVRHAMATHLTSSELHKLRNTFEHLDTDGVGTISIDRLKEVLQKDNSQHNALEGIDLSHFDLDGDGEVDWQEFVAVVMEDHEMYNEENLEKVFRDLDTDGSGTLCIKEITKLLGNDHELVREVLEGLARDRGSQGDASELQMTMPEFTKMMSTQAAPDSAVSGKRRAKTRRHHAVVSKGQMVDADDTSAPPEEEQKRI